MQIQNNYSTPAFKGHFTKNQQFLEVVEWAKKNNCLRALDQGLYNIKHANPGEITIFHGTTPDGKVYSNFRQGKRSYIVPASDATCPAEASYNGIQELGFLGRAFRSLFGTNNVTCDVTAEKIIKNYTA